MKEAWPVVSLGEVVRYRKQFIRIDDASAYKRCRVQLHALGIVERDNVPGLEIKTKEQQVCRSGELLVAEIDAKVGGFGMVPEDLDGAIVSSHYFLFTVDESRLNRRFLGFYIRIASFRDQVSAQGSTNYAAIRPQHVLRYQIPLPPLAEQRRIVARIEELAGKLDQARSIRGPSKFHADILPSRERHRAFSKLASSCGAVALGDVITVAGYGTSVKCTEGKSELSMPILRIPNVIAGALDLRDLKHAELSAGEQAKVRLMSGDLLVVRTNGSADLVGRCTVVDKLSEPMGFASYLIRIRCDTRIVDPDYLRTALADLRASGALFDLARTTAGQYNVSLGRLRGSRFPLPPLLEQRRIVAYLDDLQAKVDALKALQEKTAAELDALLPSILDKAFRSEL